MLKWIKDTLSSLFFKYSGVKKTKSLNNHTKSYKIKKHVGLNTADKNIILSDINNVEKYIIARGGYHALNEFLSDMGIEQNNQPINRIRIQKEITINNKCFIKYAGYYDIDSVKTVSRDLEDLGYKIHVKVFNQGPYNTYALYRSIEKSKLRILEKKLVSYFY